MAGIIGIITSLAILGLSMVITRLATVSLSLTGLSWETAKFQARSAFTGTGFTTSESETVVNHPVRRKIITGLMIARSAGLVSIIISLILSFGSDGEGSTRLYRLLWLSIGVAVLWFLARSHYIEQWMTRVMKKALRRWTDLEVYDYLELLKLSGEYTVRELKVGAKDWVVDKKLNQCRLNDEGITVLGTQTLYSFLFLKTVHKRWSTNAALILFHWSSRFDKGASFSEKLGLFGADPTLLTI